MYERDFEVYACFKVIVIMTFKETASCFSEIIAPWIKNNIKNLQGVFTQNVEGKLEVLKCILLMSSIHVCISRS